MTRKIKSISYTSYLNTDIETLFIDFKPKGSQGYVDEIEVPRDAGYMIFTQSKSDDDNDGNIVALTIVDLPAYMENIDNDPYLPDLGPFNYGDLKNKPLKEIIKWFVENPEDDYGER